MARTRPLFSLDTGWLFLLAGLAMFIAIMLIPARRDAHELREQLEELRTEEQYAYQRLRAYTEFLDEIDSPDPALLRRLAATQLNKIPTDERPLIISTSQVATVTGWVDNSVRFEPYQPEVLPTTALSDLAQGRHRIWLLGAAVLAMFTGLMLTPGLTATRAPSESRSRRSIREARERRLPEPCLSVDGAELEGHASDAPAGDVKIDDGCDDKSIDPAHAAELELDPADESVADIQARYGEQMLVRFGPNGQGRFTWADADGEAYVEASDCQTCDTDADGHESLLDQLQAPRLPYPMAKLDGHVEPKPGDLGSPANFGPLKAMIRDEAAAASTPDAIGDDAFTSQTSSDDPLIDTARSDSVGDAGAAPPLADDHVVDMEESPDNVMDESPRWREQIDDRDGSVVDDQAAVDDSDATRTAVADDDVESAAEDDAGTDCAVDDAPTEQSECDVVDDEEEEQGEDQDEAEFIYEYYDEQGNLIDPEDVDDDEWEFVDADDEDGDDDEEDTDPS